MSSSPRLPLALLAGACAAMVLPIYAFARWVMVFDSSRPRPDVIAEFLAGFPVALRSTGSVTNASIVGCVVAAGLAGVALSSLSGTSRHIATLVLVLALVLGAWNIFTLM